ncbi:DUF3011 domain-containing protein [Luteimonas kalidii]|uniref:DUF3011 domain-containing protein n=1 Tax=Luteimonas kalidii TaxID=3042025 RepID=A0ABT6JT14_9GAMM|nr:DUF3011 domain-containing protein [Luteimonas kalidii]MDH5833824.1 DUF3011 domain-containing protein [Luteimonas kalidii]
MGTIRNALGAGAVLLLAGCVGYPAGGYGGGPPGGGYGSGGVVRCESDDDRTRHCRVDTRGGVSLTRQLSRTQCVQGRNWGWDNSGVWVSQGCRAEFVAGRGGYGPGAGPGHGGPGYGGGGERVLRCESKNDRHQRCPVQVRRDVQLTRQLSERPCVRTQNWGWDRSGVWVDGGCRAEFRVR